MVKQIYLIKR